MNADLTLSADQVALVRRYLDQADATRPATVAGEPAHYQSLVRLRVIVEMVLSDAVDRATSCP